jgi:hypothetical protein
MATITVEKRRLARPVGSDEAEDLALVDLEVHVSESAQTTELHRDVVDLEKSGHR